MNTTLEMRVTRSAVRDPVVQQNEAVIRQGEWLFVPAPGLIVDVRRVRRHAPVSHRDDENLVMEELFRTGGEAVYYSASKRRVLTVPQYRKLLLQRPSAVKEDWRIRPRDVVTYGRGAVRQPDHSPITLAGWHRILMNTESLAQSLRHAALQE